VKALLDSGLYNAAPDWSGIIIQHLRLGKDCVQFLIEAAEKIAAESGNYTQPFSNEVWEKACEVYRGLKIF
jgi:hypothetical protein